MSTAMRRFSRRRVVRGFAAAALVLGVAACGDAAGPGSEVAEAAEDEPTTSTDASSIEITAVDFAFEDLPETVPAGTKLTLANASSTELHELVAFRLPDDETRSADELMALSEDELGAMFAGPPAAVLLAPPGADEAIAAVGDGTLADPGRYLIICAIPTGADPDEFLAAAETSDGPPEVEGGPPHLVHEMYAELEVE